MKYLVAKAEGQESKPLGISRPKWDDVYKHYPKTNAGTASENDKPAVELFSELFGKDYDRSLFSNACATRLSIALIGAGMSVKTEFVIAYGSLKGKGITTSAKNILTWLSSSSVFGEADIIIKKPASFNVISSKIGEKKGIYIIDSNNYKWASGHVTLWYDGHAIGHHDYWEHAKEVHFWELK